MQSDIFKYVVETIKKSLTKNSENKFTVVDELIVDKKNNQVKVDVTDIYQTSNDKTGQRIIVDEKRYEVPTQFVMNIQISFAGKNLEEELSIIGLVAVILKDNSVFNCDEYNWHGNDLNKFFVEPIVRKTPLECGKIHLDYRVEVQLNSRKGESFTRVEKKDLSAKQIN